MHDLTRKCRAGSRHSLQAWRDLAELLFCGTIGATGSSLAVHVLGNRRGHGAVGGRPEIGTPLALNNGAFLKFTMSLKLRHRRLIVDQSAYQYQLDPEGRDWVFRYDYRRRPTDRYAAAHVQVRGDLKQPAIAPRGLERIHLPTGRVSFEAVIRLLVEDFDVPCRWPTDVWRPVLHESVILFLRDATIPPSGPSS